MSPRTFAAMSAAQKKVIDTTATEWAGKFADPWADFEHAAGQGESRAGPRGLSDHWRAAQGMERSRPSRWKQWIDNGARPAAIPTPS
jgi:hypothetical protein